MKQISFALFLGWLVLMASCGNNSQGEALASVEKERDSLFAVNSQQQSLLNDITSTMAEITSSLDSIAIQEQMIVRRVDEFGNPLSRNDLKERLSVLADYIGELRSRMYSMEETLDSDKAVIAQFKGLIDYLNATLEQKDAEIQNLQAELEKKNFNIAQLRMHVTHLKDTVANVQKENEEQKLENDEQRKKLLQQENSLNEVFYVIGSKNQLINYGVLTKSGSIFKKVKLNFASINKSALVKGDKRTLKTITISGKSPKILSEEPKGSYQLEGSGDNYVLTILNTEQFWSANNKILVIQVK